MCCSFVPRNNGSSEFELPVPYLQSAFEHDLPRWEYLGRPRTLEGTRRWRQIACRHQGSSLAERLCATADWGTL